MLEQKLKKLAKATNIYPFHMPGHKRVPMKDFPDPYSIDITEIEEFDNLHHPQGVLKEEQERAAKLYGSRRCYFLVNGSTCGILAAVSAAVPRGGKILVARNCHKSVYNAIYLRQLSPVYVYPVDASYGLQGQVRAEDIARRLSEHPDILAVVITSPTYDGIVSDIEAIAEAVHSRGIPLIVDEAHGAHFGLHEAFPENATRLGADAVIMSIHKTLPSFTQTALLHLCSERIDADAVSRFLGIYETSSPSYLLMAGMSRCMHMMELDSAHGKFDRYVQLLDKFRKGTSALKCFHVLGEGSFKPAEAYAFDIGKIIIDTGDSGITGQQLKKDLLNLYGLQTEMAGGNYVLAMTSIMDSPKGFDRLKSALEVLDEQAAAQEHWVERLEPADIYRQQDKCMEPYEAADAAHETVPLAEANDRICADYVYLYPPGIPILVPGERITEWTRRDLWDCMQKGLDVEGIAGDHRIQVVKIW